MSRNSFILTLAAMALAFLVIGYVKTASHSQSAQPQIDSKNKGTLKQQVKQAKLRGENQLILSGLVTNYAHVKDLDDALARFSLVLVQPVERRSYIDENEFISSWYKFKIIEVLSQPRVQRSLDFLNPPAELLPLAEDEILIPKGGGSVLVDGISVTLEEDNSPAFENSQKYLMFLSLDAVKKVGIAELGPVGSFTVKADNSIESVDGRPRHLQQEMQKDGGNSLERIKEKLKHRGTLN